jgi:hypothetical protein
MAVTTVGVVMNRIMSATEESPIAVFRADDKYLRESGFYESVFASTVETQARIESGGPDFVGTFHAKSDSPKEILSRIK